MEVLNVQMQALARELNDIEARLEAIEAERRSSQAPDEERFAELSVLIEETQAQFEELTATVEEKRPSLSCLATPTMRPVLKRNA